LFSDSSPCAQMSVSLSQRAIASDGGGGGPCSHTVVDGRATWHLIHRCPYIEWRTVENGREKMTARACVDHIKHLIANFPCHSCDTASDGVRAEIAKLDALIEKSDLDVSLSSCEDIRNAISIWCFNFHKFISSKIPGRPPNPLPGGWDEMDADKARVDVLERLGATYGGSGDCRANY